MSMNSTTRIAAALLIAALAGCGTASDGPMPATVHAVVDVTHVGAGGAGSPSGYYPMTRAADAEPLCPTSSSSLASRVMRCFSWIRRVVGCRLHPTGR